MLSTSDMRLPTAVGAIGTTSRHGLNTPGVTPQSLMGPEAGVGYTVVTSGSEPPPDDVPIQGVAALIVRYFTSASMMSNKILRQGEAWETTRAESVELSENVLANPCDLYKAVDALRKLVSADQTVLCVLLSRLADITDTKKSALGRGLVRTPKGTMDAMAEEMKIAVRKLRTMVQEGRCLNLACGGHRGLVILFPSHESFSDDEKLPSLDTILTRKCRYKDAKKLFAELEAELGADISALCTLGQDLEECVHGGINFGLMGKLNAAAQRGQTPGATIKYVLESYIGPGTECTCRKKGIWWEHHQLTRDDDLDEDYLDMLTL